MTYTQDINALGASHHYPLSANSTDVIGTANGTDTSITYTSSAIALDATNSAGTDATGDRITFPSVSTINSAAQSRKAVAMWVQIDSIQPPPKRLYGEGNATTVFQLVLAYGNNVMLEVRDSSSDVQVFSNTTLVASRPYHITALFSGNGFDNIVDLYLDGVKQIETSIPANRQPNAASLAARTQGELGDPAGATGIGGGTVLLQAPINGSFNHLCVFDGSNAALTDEEVREILFEKGTLADVTIASGTQAAMQTALNALSSTLRPNHPCCIRVEAVSGGGNLELTANAITFDPLASIHVQYMGSGTLTWINDNGSNASLVSTPSSGTVSIVTPTTVTVKIIDATTLQPIQGARVFLEADSGGPLAAGTDLVNDLTDALGEVEFSFNHTVDQPITGRARKGTSTPLYKTGVISGTITDTGLSVTVLLVAD